jgi:hypothetical protein
MAARLSHIDERADQIPFQKYCPSSPAFRAGDLLFYRCMRKKQRSSGLESRDAAI